MFGNIHTTSDHIPDTCNIVNFRQDQNQIWFFCEIFVIPMSFTISDILEISAKKLETTHLNSVELFEQLNRFWSCSFVDSTTKSSWNVKVVRKTLEMSSINDFPHLAGSSFKICTVTSLFFQSFAVFVFTSLLTSPNWGKPNYSFPIFTCQLGAQSGGIFWETWSIWGKPFFKSGPFKWVLGYWGPDRLEAFKWALPK